MNGLLFPVFGALLVFLVFVPLLTLLARSASGVAGVVPQAKLFDLSSVRFTLLVAPTLGPLIWLVSAVVHQTHTGARLSACLVDHFGSEICQDVVIFGLLLLAILAVGIVGRATTGATRQGRRRPSGRQRASSRAREATERVARACLKHPALAPLLARVRVVAEGVAPLCTRGWLAPYVEVEARLVLSLEEEELTAALLHEAEHLRARDPLLQLFAQVALSLNPLGRWLAPEYARYHLTREALCDRRAVQNGADPLALARSIVSVARPAAVRTPVCCLGGDGISGVRFRVQLLLGYASNPLQPTRASLSLGLTPLVFVLVAALPHWTGTGPLDTLHHAVEHTAMLAGL